MSDVASSLPVPDPAPKRRSPWFYFQWLGFNFLTLSILAHVFFGMGATYFVVQTIQAKRKQTFAGPASSPNASTRAIEHKVQMQKKQQTMSAPAAVKRITTTSNTKVALPAMPQMSKMDSAIVPLTMSGMGGSGVGTGMGTGGSGGSGGGGGLSLFGIRDSKGGTLRGTFFDLKQTAALQPIKSVKPPLEEYKNVVSQFIKGGMHDSTLTGRYFKGPSPLYATQLFIPQMNASEGPKAFNLEGRVQPSRWIVHYQGTVTPPESGSYRFVGVADDVLVVKFNGAVVLDCGVLNPSGNLPSRYYVFDGLPQPGPKSWFKGCGEGNAFSVEAGQSYPIDIALGEWPGGFFMAYLLLRKEGVDYKKDSRGNPILPLFRLVSGTLPYSKGMAPVYDKDGPIWKGGPPPAQEP